MDVADERDDTCLDEIAFRWMFHSGSLKYLQEQCEKYQSENLDIKVKEKSVYRVILPVDVGELMDFNAQLGNIVCNISEKGREVFQQACFICIQTLNWIPQVNSKSQILLQMRYLSIPHHISISSVSGLRRDLSENTNETLSMFTTVGIVNGMTSRTNYTQSTWYKCLNQTCHMSDGNGFALHYPSCSGSEHLRAKLPCFGCRTLLEEDISCRVLGEKCLLQVVCPDALTCSSSENREHLFRSLSVHVRDELINEVELGACYSFSLLPVREFLATVNSSQLNLVFEANNLVKITRLPLLMQQCSSSLKPEASSCLSLFNGFNSNFTKLQALYRERRTSSWSFSACLAYFFGDSITPAGTYFRLKLGLLLSLVSQQSSNKEEHSSTSGGRIHIMAVSKDILQIQRLLQFSKSFALRSVTFSPCNDLCYSTSKDPSNPGSCMICSGCLPLANDGVCVLRNLFFELKSDQVEELENVLQNEYVTIEVPKRYIGCQQSQISVPLRCKIWACCETFKKNGNRYHHNTYQQLQESGKLPKTLIDNFSLVFIMDDIFTDSLAENRIIQDILNKAILGGKQSEYNIPDNEFREFIQYVSSIKLSFSKKARELIQGFYLSSRRVRSSSGTGGPDFPIAALKSMMSLAEAHARLSLRTEVSEDDAVLAILLYEESITARVGYSVLGVTPLYHFKDGNIMNYIGTENDERMLQLKIHMKRFCCLHSHYKYIPGCSGHEE